MGGLTYPVYVLSKGRARTCTTPGMLAEAGIPFRMVVESQEADEYAARFGWECLIIAPFQNVGTPVPARNLIREYAIAGGTRYYWQVDDDVTGFCRVVGDKRERCGVREAMGAIEAFADRYENIGLISPTGANWFPAKVPAYRPNAATYIVVLTRVGLPCKYRGVYGDDTDYALQVLSSGWCSVAVEEYKFYAAAIMSLAGGLTEGYKAGGQEERVRELMRRWPGIVGRKGKTGFTVIGGWHRFRIPLIAKKAGADG